MKRSSRTLLATFSLFSLVVGSHAKELKITDFDSKENAKLGWQVVDDGVMGGLSKGKVDFTKSGTLRFGGKLSLENNGGFSSLRTKDIKLDLSDYSGLIMRVKGDGRTYGVRVASDARYRGMEVSFMADFATKKGKWIEVKVPFGDLVGGWRGRSLKDETFNPAKIQRLGLILADKKAGNFQLEVDWIHAYSAGASGKPGTIVDVAVADGRFKTLAAALTEAQLVDAIQGDGPFTVFAPTDKAFSKLSKGTVESLLKPENREQLQSILKYHVIAGEIRLAGALDAGKAKTLQGDPVSIAFAEGKVRVNQSAILDADIKCSNGVIHVVDTVLLPPAPPEPVVTTDILGVAKSAGSFKTLIAAVEAAGLDSVLAGEGPFTVFAPTDAAFAKLPKGTVGTLLKKENLGQLKALLTYHVVAGKVSAGDALNAKSAKTVNGQPVEFAISAGSLKVNDVTISTVDIACDNGVIHVIDGILMPTKKQAKADPAVLIEEAIDLGVPAFNRGDAAKCAKIYQDCLKELAGNESISTDVRSVLKEVLEGAGKGDGDRDQAWLFRRALDLAYHSVSE